MLYPGVIFKAYILDLPLISIMCTEVEIRFIECLVTCPSTFDVEWSFYNLSGHARHSRQILYLFLPVYSLTR